MTFSTRLHRRELTRFLKFMVVGAIGFVVDFGTFNLLTALIGLWSVLASALSFTAAVCSNFMWNRYWTYPDSRSKSIRVQMLQFFVVNLAGLAIRTPIYWIGERPAISLAQSTLAAASQGPLARWASLVPVDGVFLGRNLALATAVLVVLLWNFAANRIWTYSDVK
jgi:putative flippase GtrA